MSLEFGPPVIAAGVAMPFPELTLGYWLNGISVPAQPEFVISSGLDVTVVTVDTESGRAENKAVAGVSGGGGSQVELIQEGLWDVVLVDTFNTQPQCTEGVLADTPLGDVERFFLGGSGRTTRLNRGHVDGVTNVLGNLNPNVVAPAGLAARCIFKNVYLAIQGNSGGYVLLTPIVDGVVLTEAAVVILMPYTGSRFVKRFEIPLWRDTGPNRQGLVGTWFSFLLEHMDIANCGRIGFDGWELEYEPLTESLQGQAFTGRTYNDPVRDPVAKWFMGGLGPGIRRGGVGTDDDGVPIAPVLVTNEVAPAGVGGETLFQNVYLMLIRRNTLAWTLSVTPILDGIALPAISVTLAGVSGEVSEVVEVPLSQNNGYVTYHPRGAWMSLKASATESPDLPVEFHGVELEYEILTESVGDVTNA